MREDLKKMDDDELVRQLVAVNHDAIRHFFVRFGPSVRRWSGMYSGLSNADDLTQEILTKAVQRAGSFDGNQASLQTWLNRIAKNHCTDFNRQRGRRIQGAAGGPDRSDTVDTIGDLDPAFKIEFDGCLELLTELERDAFQSIRIDGERASDYAERVDEERTTVSERLSRATRKLKECMKRKGFPQDPNQ